MPTERFYRLSEEKRRTIRDAAFHEFARVPVDKASINQIIREADISRGSFYTYFEDKWDILAYIFEESQREMRDHIYICLEKSGGDIWETLDRFLEKVIEVCCGEEKQQFIRNVMDHTDAEELFGGFKKRQGEVLDEVGMDTARWVYTRYSREKMREMSYQEFFAFFQLAMLAIAMEVKRYFDGRMPDEIWESYQRKIGILRRGVAP